LLDPNWKDNQQLPPIEILLQPKQRKLRALVWYAAATWIGIGGGRGGAKSAALQRIMLGRRIGLPATVGAIVMRNYDQVKRYHIDPLLRAFPCLSDHYLKSDSKIILPMGKDANGQKIPDSEIHFTYAESLDDVIRRFRSANYFDLMVDQAEQFSEEEIREMKQCVRWPEGQVFAEDNEGPKMILSHNMGGMGFDFLRKKFHLKELDGHESSDDFVSLHVFPWDNVEWVRAALRKDGLTDVDYYERFTEEQRQEYCAKRASYGRALYSQDDALRERDWFGSWKTPEGTFFGRAWDHGSTVITEDRVESLIKPWWKRWIAEDWGQGHYNSNYWNARGLVSPEDARKILGWENVTKPLNVTITYREYIAGGAGASDEGGDRELGEQDIAREIVDRTDPTEIPTLRNFFLSPDAFELSVRRAGQEQIAKLMGDILHAAGFPRPVKAINARKGGWKLMYNLLLATKKYGIGHEAATDNTDVWLISVNCVELIAAIPLAMRNPKDLDDILKTDMSAARIEQDALDGGRYSLMSMLGPGRQPDSLEMEDRVNKALWPLGEGVGEPNYTAANLERLRCDGELKKKRQRVVMQADWRRRLEEQ
jgi:hypothetical protein